MSTGHARPGGTDARTRRRTGAPLPPLRSAPGFRDDPSGATPDTGAWCYDWWASNSYPTDQCFWWAGSALGGILEDGKEYYAWVFLTSADGTSSPGGTTSPLVEAFYTPVIPGAQAGICTCYAQAHRADPVNTATGMFFEQLTDASLVSPGVPLALERTYRSDSSAVGLLGRGWATPFDAELTMATGKVTYRTDDGASFVFTQNSDGTYAAPAPVSTSRCARLSPAAPPPTTTTSGAPAAPAVTGRRRPGGERGTGPGSRRRRPASASKTPATWCSSVAASIPATAASPITEKPGRTVGRSTAQPPAEDSCPV
ncbi:DUF6531 domain-containing protein, partial [Streptomyces pseudogriseolus]|uniref:DUF6531 domain-containing protein n=1 Tax=Streptomyces pseudogriseolus TaxID=36817 RepID=UPI003490CAC5